MQTADLDTLARENAAKMAAYAEAVHAEERALAVVEMTTTATAKAEAQAEAQAAKAAVNAAALASFTAYTAYNKARAAAR